MARRVLLAVLLLIAPTFGCEAFRSDAENFSRQRRAERARAVAGMRAATRQTTRGTDVAGEALARTVSGRTHVFENGAFSADEHCYRLAAQPDGRVQYYVADPGAEADGLLTKITDRVLDGPPDP